MDSWEEVGVVYFCEVGKKGTTIGRDGRGIAVLPEKGRYVEMHGVYLGMLRYKEKENGTKYGIFRPLSKLGVVLDDME